MVEEVDVDADADVGLHAFGCESVARLDAEAPAAGLGSGQGCLAHDERTGVDLDAVELGAVPAHPGRVSRVAVPLLRNREHHRLRVVTGRGGQDIGGIFSNVCKIGRVCRYLDRHVPHHLLAHGHGATDAQGVADDEGVAAHGVHGRFGAATRSHNQTAKGVGGEQEQEVEEEDAKIFHAAELIVCGWKLLSNFLDVSLRREKDSYSIPHSDSRSYYAMILRSVGVY